MRLDHLLSKEEEVGESTRVLGRATPVPIPNTMVKPQTADGTMLETAWESRWLPDSLKKKAGRQLLYIDTDISEWDVKSLREKMC